MVDLGYEIALALPGLRAQAESRMKDSCVVHGDPVKVWNPATLDYDYTPTVIYTGKCRIRFADTAVQRDEAAGQLFAEQVATLSLPFSEPTSGDVQSGHTVTITASPEDSARVGDKFTIDAFRRQTDGTARRFPLKETQ